MDLARVWSWDNWQRLLVGDYFNTGHWGGLALTLAIGLLAIPLATLIGSVFGVLRTSRIRALRWAAAGYVNAFRNVPLLILVFWAYFLPPVLGFELSKFPSVLLAIVIYTGAYLTDIIASGIRAVPATHVQAARALGLGPLQVQLRVVLPQAFFNMLPALCGRYVLAIKDTSLAFLIGLTELTEIGHQINAQLMSAPVAVYATVLAIYFAVNSLLSAAFARLETRSRFGKVFIRF